MLKLDNQGCVMGDVSYLSADTVGSNTRILALHNPGTVAWPKPPSTTRTSTSTGTIPQRPSRSCRFAHTAVFADFVRDVAESPDLEVYTGASAAHVAHRSAGPSRRGPARFHTGAGGHRKNDIKYAGPWRWGCSSLSLEILHGLRNDGGRRIRWRHGYPKRVPEYVDLPAQPYHIPAGRVDLLGRLVLLFTFLQQHGHAGARSTRRIQTGGLSTSVIMRFR